MAPKRNAVTDLVPTSDLPENMRPKDAAAFLTVSVAQLAVWRADGTGPEWFRLGARSIVYRSEGLRAFVSGNLRKGA